MWEVMVLVPKGGGYYQGIGMMGVIWKMIKFSTNWILAEIDLQGALQGYQERIRMEASGIKTKLYQQLVVLSQTPLLHILGLEKLIQ